MTEICPVCGGVLPDGALTCPACGFRAQGATQSFQPISFSDDLQNEFSEQPEKHAVLRVVRGPQTGIIFELNKPYMTIGRNPQCDIFLNDMTVSRQHAYLKLAGGVWTIYDDNSFNGVWVKNTSVDKHQLQVGEIVQIGAFCLQYSDE